MKQSAFYTLLLIVLSLTVLTACDNDDHDHEHEHEDAFGVALFIGSNQVAIQEGGVISYADGSHLSLSVGETTETMSVRFIAEDGDLFTPEDDDFFLEIENNNTSVATTSISSGSPYNFTITGVSEGEAQLQFELIHVNHADFTSLPFIVVVE